jgi:hypothetical protein
MLLFIYTMGVPVYLRHVHCLSGELIGFLTMRIPLFDPPIPVKQLVESAYIELNKSALYA